MRSIAFMLVLLALVFDAVAEENKGNSIIIGLQGSSMTPSAFGQEEVLEWNELSLEIEGNYWDRAYLPSGIAIGFRKSGPRYNEGTYVTARVFKAWDAGVVEIHPSLTMVFGTPGVLLNQSWVERDAQGNATSFTRLHPIRSFPVPANGVHKIGIIYPEASVAFRRRLWRFHVEPLIGMKFIRMGATRSNFKQSYERRFMGFAPTVAIRVGYRFF